MFWANFLHIYQPPTQKPYWVKRVTDESYRKIFRGLAQSPKAKLTLNINGVLLELLDANGCGDVIALLRQLVEQGQVELVGSAKYHAMLPFLPEAEVIRQIQLNEQALKKYLGSNLVLKGFFPPEMAFDPKLVPVLKRLGYQWIIADELSFPGEPGAVKYDRIYTDADNPDVGLFFRERRMSWVILSGQVGTGNLLVESLGERLKKHEYLLTAMDGETFGHHRPGLENLLFEMFDSKDLQNATISELFGLFEKREPIRPQPSTWALMQKDLERNKPFSRWQDPDNAIHKLQWELTYMAIGAMEQAPQDDPAFPAAREKLDRALHSDQYWWASARPWWSIEMIERGAKELYDAVLAIPKLPDDTRERARHLYHTIVFTAFDWQRSGLVDQLAHQEDEEVRQMTDTGLPKLPKGEVDKMIAHLQEEMKLVADRQEYERAAQIRDRIKELKTYIAETPAPVTSPEGDREFKLNA
jgi:hypothetical protein